LANSVVMAWNTAWTQAIIDGWSEPVPAEMMGCIAPTRIEGIHLRGIFRFPIERFAEPRLPSHTARTAATPG
jgi:hypothetical protein